jgi:IS30 family transposase
MDSFHMSDAEKAEIWRLTRQGLPVRVVCRRIGRASGSVRGYLARSGGVRPPVRRRAPDRLTLPEREEIFAGLVAGLSLRAIAARLGRAPSTVSREVAGNGGRVGYRPTRAENAAWLRASRPKPAKLAANSRLRTVVEEKLAEDWSPQQIAGWLGREFAEEPEMQVSHETIYLSLFVQARGALKRDLTTHLRSRRVMRRPRTRSGHGHGQGQIVDAISIRERPAEAEDRAVPGHWEGDLLLGSGHSQIATLVERHTRFVMLIALPKGKVSEHVVDALARQVQTLPVQLRRSLTWDRGLELAEHKRFSIATGVKVYFCDPRSPWQRGSNENTNGLLRQYFPKRSSVARFTQADLDAIAAKLNGRPRQTLEWLTPSQKLAEVLR